jgi:hypothetical protein
MHAHTQHHMREWGGVNLQDGHKVAQALPACCRCAHSHIFAIQQLCDRFHLMFEQPSWRDAQNFQTFPHTRVQLVLQVAKLGMAGGHALDVNNLILVQGALL